MIRQLRVRRATGAARRAPEPESEAACCRRAHANEQRLRALSDHCPECIKLLRPDGMVLDINAAGLRLLEADSPDQVLGRSVFDVIAPEDRERFRALHESVCGGKSAQLEFKIIGLKGASRSIETHAVPVPDPDGPGFLHLAITRDLTRRKQEDEIRQLLSAAVASSDDAIVTKDLNGTITSWNGGAERIFGYTAAEVVGRPVTILIPEDRLDEEPGILRRLRNGEPIEHYETIRRTKTGELLDISLTVSPVKNAEGQIIGASKIARDITSRKRAEAELRATKEKLAGLNAELERRVRERTASLTEAISQMEEFSYTVSHDLRAPVRAMRGYARIALEDFSEGLRPEVREYLERILSGGERMDRLIEDLLTYSRLSRRELKLQPVALEKLIGEVTRHCPELQPPRATLILRRPLQDVLAHESSLAQALANLLGNAVKFVPAGRRPEVTLRTEARGKRIRLWVEDNGIGIRPEFQHRIFGMFERLPTPLPYEGTGVGLAIVRKAADKMGGTTGLESDGRSGSRFWIELARA